MTDETTDEKMRGCVVLNTGRPNLQCVCVRAHGSPAGTRGAGRRHAGCRCRPRAHALQVGTAETLWAPPCPEPSAYRSSSAPRRVSDSTHRPTGCAASPVHPPGHEYLRKNTQHIIIIRVEMKGYMSARTVCGFLPGPALHDCHASMQQFVHLLRN